VTPEESTRFNRAYRPVKQIDDQRLEDLYPTQIDPTIVQRYLSEFEALLADARSRGIRVIVIKPPIPERLAKVIPGEEAFDAHLAEVVRRQQVAFHDFTHVDNDDKLFYDTDHLNKNGVLNFFEHSLVPVLSTPQ